MNIINVGALKGSLSCHVMSLCDSEEVESQDGSLFSADSSETVSERK